jgi:hypothetical protein
VSQQINLFNPVFLKQRKVFSALAMARALGVFALGLAAFTVYSIMSADALSAQATALESQLKLKEARMVEVDAKYPPRKKSPQLEQELATAEAQLHAMDEISVILTRGEFGNTKGYAEYFRAFARQNVSGLWLTGVTISGAGDEIDIHGRALQAQLVPGYIGKLAAEPVLKGKTFANLRIGQPRDGVARATEDQNAPTANSAAPSKPGKAKDDAPKFIEFDLEARPAAGTQ